MLIVKGDPSYSLILRVLLTITTPIVLIFLALSATTMLLLRQPVLALDLYDNFEGHHPYTITDNQTSPNGKWFNKYNGFGATGTANVTPTTATDNDNNNTVFYEEPKTSTSPNETHAALTLTTQIYEDVDLQLKVKTNEQLRQNSTPNPWEVAWIMWRFQDDWHHYYFIFKPNGVELGKKQN